MRKGKSEALLMIDVGFLVTRPDVPTSDCPHKELSLSSDLDMWLPTKGRKSLAPWGKWAWELLISRETMA